MVGGELDVYARGSVWREGGLGEEEDHEVVEWLGGGSREEEDILRGGDGVEIGLDWWRRGVSSVWRRIEEGVGDGRLGGGVYQAVQRLCSRTLVELCRLVSSCVGRLREVSILW